MFGQYKCNVYLCAALPHMGAQQTMTYYLERHLTNGVVDTIPYTAERTLGAIETGRRLHVPRYPATYAQVRDCTGRVIATFAGNDKLSTQPVRAKHWTQLALDL